MYSPSFLSYQSLEMSPALCTRAQMHTLIYLKSLLFDPHQLKSITGSDQKSFLSLCPMIKLLSKPKDEPLKFQPSRLSLFLYCLFLLPVSEVPLLPAALCCLMFGKGPFRDFSCSFFKLTGAWTEKIRRLGRAEMWGFSGRLSEAWEKEISQKGCYKKEEICNQSNLKTDLSQPCSHPCFWYECSFKTNVSELGWSVKSITSTATRCACFMNFRFPEALG